MHGCSGGGVRGCSEGGMCGCSGGVHGCSGGHAWLFWGMHGCSGGACLVALGGGMHGCSGGACVVALGGHAWDMMRYRDTINERAVRILLECILVCSLQRYYYISAYLGIEEKVKFRIAFMTQKHLPCQLIFGHLHILKWNLRNPNTF